MELAFKVLFRYVNNTCYTGQFTWMTIYVEPARDWSAYSDSTTITFWQTHICIYIHTNIYLSAEITDNCSTIHAYLYKQEQE